MKRFLAVVLLPSVLMGWGCGGKHFTVEGKTAKQWSHDLSNDDWSVRNKAIISIAQIAEHEPAAVPYLAQALEDPNPDNRLFAVRMLGGLGSQAKSALPALETTLKDHESHIRTEAQQAIARIRS